jgi:N utilization substance protein B
MQYLYALEISDFEDTKEHHKNLLKGIESIHDQYILQISFLIEIFKKAKSTYTISKDKLFGNASSKYSNERMSKNIFLVLQNSKITSLINSRDFINWEVDYKYVTMIYNEFINTDLFKHYISSDDNSFDLDRKLIYNLCKDIIMPNEKFQEFLEEKNIFWMDDFPLVNTMILKFIKNCTVKSFDKNFYFKLYSNSSDKKYSNDLANLSLRNFKKNNELINKYVSNWDVDRIAKIDLVILNLAITEIIDFKLIPVKVSLNEFIEISKDYSTEKSSFFINGILDKLVKDLLEKKSLIKEGRGLRE